MMANYNIESEIDTQLLFIQFRLDLSFKLKLTYIGSNELTSVL